MSEKTTRGKRSKIDLLPEEVKALLDKMLRDAKHSQVEILEAVNAFIEDNGYSDAIKPSKSGINRYSSKMEQVGKNLREMREISKVWVAQLGDKPTGEVTKLVLEMGRAQLFKAMMNTDDAKEVDVSMIKDVMLACQRLEQTAMLSHKREKEIRKAFAEEVAKLTETTAKSAGLTAAAVTQLKNEILGIA
ncbi:MAG: DUF3486 family protein [Psychromonas sp.]